MPHQCPSNDEGEASQPSAFPFVIGGALVGHSSFRNSLGSVLMAGALVQVRDLFKSFVRGAEEIKVLQDLTLDVGTAEFLALMGPSGSGKTTLLNLIAGLDQPTAGNITIGDNVISEMSESELAHWRTRHVGFIFQFYNLMPVLTAYENVELPLLLLPLTKDQRRKQA